MSDPNKDIHPRLVELDAVVKRCFAEGLRRPFVLKFLSSPAASDRRTYAMYLTQAYHYTYHTARNQGLVGVNAANTDAVYMKYCFEHALEEVGHELMALHDLRAIGVVADDPQVDLPRPLPATELIIAYLYYVSTQGNPVQRLGYSYWAERAYPYGSKFLEAAQARMKLKRSEMTFWYVHSELDVKHADDVERALVNACKTDDDWRAVARVTETTIALNFDMMEQAIGEAEKLIAGEPSEYNMLSEQVRPVPADA